MKKNLQISPMQKMKKMIKMMTAKLKRLAVKKIQPMKMIKKKTVKLKRVAIKKTQQFLQL